MNQSKRTLTMQASRWARASRRFLSHITGFTVLIERRWAPLVAR